ncbi:hypothetical protein RE432_02875 [Pusillimonas sp. SM2304]|nr:hypothetical protein [Pusillimonas sp. SM2304]MDS1139364.1 hypothetical protein [Pusillimonas sp. SM2304]
MVNSLLPLERAVQMARSRSLHALFLGSQDVAVRSAYARAKPG